MIFGSVINILLNEGSVLGASDLDFDKNTPSRWAPDEVLENSFIEDIFPGVTGILNQVLPLLFDVIF
jgi:hypothetical protein